MPQVFRYHPLLVTLHWFLAVLIVATLAIGFLWLGATPNSSSGKASVLQIHMAVGVLILLLMATRFVVRYRTPRPPSAMRDRPALARLALFTHYAFYVLVALIGGTGCATAISAGLAVISFTASSLQLPPTFDNYPTFVAHALLATVLANIVVLHIFAACYHQFIRRDGLFGRMSFGRDDSEHADRKT